MADPEHQSAIDSFREITGVEDPERAKFYLESSAWQFDVRR